MMADLSSSLRSLMRTGLESYLRVYHRHDIYVDADVPEPVLLVGNHGFGGLVDLNVLVMFAVQRAVGFKRPTTALVHQVAWTVGAGKIAEAMGGQPASCESAEKAFAAGNNVLVFPGGDVDAAKPWANRNRVSFQGRSGFARLAIDRKVPIVPIVTAGAGESLFVISDGRRLARALQLPRFLRVKALPVSVSMPWGLNVGVVGMLPYLALPTKLQTAVLPAMYPDPDESAEKFARRVEVAMQTRLDELVTDRKPVLG
jgi:1-acyl-sn-glycerol-3-phosphate acyltransferase